MSALPRVWELRWINNALPTLFDAAALAIRLGRPEQEIEERDFYLDSGSPAVNLKIRHRTNALKLKVLRARTNDGFEEWQTEIDEPLPAGDASFRTALRLMGSTANPHALGAARSADAALDLLRSLFGSGRLIAVDKTRCQFVRGSCRVDRAELIVGDRRLSSLGVESLEISPLRTIVDELRLRELGEPCNYTELLFGAAGTSRSS